ncbi:MAG: hypothetical protein H8D65_01720, partial [Spirochaetes bacterium]|nr:hypothetical protein [Spirochaetota bacterium]
MNELLQMFSLKGKTALLTGGAGGYGKNCVRALAGGGGKTFIASRNINGLPGG